MTRTYHDTIWYHENLYIDTFFIEDSAGIIYSLYVMLYKFSNERSEYFHISNCAVFEETTGKQERKGQEKKMVCQFIVF